MTIGRLFSLLKTYADASPDAPVEIMYWDDDEQEYAPRPLISVAFEVDSDGALFEVRLRAGQERS